MHLIIDIGNTNIVFALFEGEAMIQSWRQSTLRTRSSDEYAAFLLPLLKACDLDWQAMEGVMVASVVPESDFQIRSFCRTYLKQDPLFITKDHVDIALKLDKPEEVGADRLVNALAVKAFYQNPAIVIDFGTATTFDVIDQNGAYCGGVIAPGIHLSVDALSRATSKLPRVAIEKPEFVIGANTKQAIQSGIFWGYHGLIAGILSGITKELGARPFVLATGGLATLFAAHMPAIQKVDDALTLKGINLVYHSQKRKN